MAYDTLKAEIRQYIKTNGANEITGQILQNVLLDMVNAYPSLDGYATQQWVNNQLNDMATMTWVGQNFVQNSALNNYLPLSGGVMTGEITAGTLSTGSYSLGNTGLSFEYSYNGSPRYAHVIRISSVDGTIAFYGRGMTEGTVIEGGQITSDKFIVTNGTSAQFLKADGSVDSTSYLPLTGGTITGNLGVNGYLTFDSNLLYSGNSDFYIGRNNSGAVNTGNARLRLGANLAMLYSGLSYNFFGLDSGGNFVCRLYDTLVVIDQNQNDKIILLYSYDEYNGALRTDCDFISSGSVTGSSFIKTGGTSSQFLKADGSVDSTSYLPLTGGTITGNLGVNGYLTFDSNLLYSGNSDFYIGRNNSGAVNTGNARLRLGANLAMLYSGLSYNFFGLDSGGNFVCRLYDTLVVIDQNQNDKIILLYSYDEYNGALRTDCDFISSGSVTGSSFIKTGGTSSQFLKADGSVDNNTYLTSSAISDMATQTWVGQQGFLTSVPSGYATETWVGNNYLPLTGGTITSNLAVNGEFDTFSRMQVNGTSADKPFIRLHIPNVNWARLQMDTDGVIHVMDGSHGTSYNGFACGNLDVNGTLKIAPNKSLSFGTNMEIFKVSTTGMLVMKNDEHDIVLGSIGNNFYVSFIEDIQGGTANSDYSLNTYNWGITTAGAATFVSVTQTSDIRRKNIISDIGMAIDDIANAPLFKFTWKDGKDENVHIGTSAQYWQGLMPELTSENKNGVLGMQYDVAAMAGVITVAKSLVDHEQRIAELEKENALLKAKLNIN